MGNTWFIKMKHFLNEDGTLAGLPPPAARLAGYFGSIIEAVTSQPSEISIETSVKCRRRPGHKPCRGEIFAYMNEQEGRIEWQCSLCGDKGIITDWEGTIWDKTS